MRMTITFSPKPSIYLVHGYARTPVNAAQARHKVQIKISSGFCKFGAWSWHWLWCILMKNQEDCARALYRVYNSRCLNSDLSSSFPPLWHPAPLQFMVWGIIYFWIVHLLGADRFCSYLGHGARTRFTFPLISKQGTAVCRAQPVRGRPLLKSPQGSTINLIRVLAIFVPLPR